MTGRPSRATVAAVLSAPESTPRWAWLAAAGAVILGLLVAFQDVLSPARGLMFRDHVLVFRPRAAGLVEALSSGRWPGLTRASAIGVPLELQLNGTWTPPTALLFVGDVEVAYDLFVLSHFVLLAVGVLLLARALGATPLAAAAAAAVAALSGPMISTENLVVMLQGLAWLPWVGLGLVHVHRAAAGPAAAATAVAVGFHLQGIIPVVLALDLALVVVLALHLRPSRRALVVATSAGVWGLAIASVELMPLLTVLGQTERGQGFAYVAQSGWAVSPAMFPELLVPSFWAPPEVPVLNVPSVTGHPDDPPYFVSLYLGTALPLALAGGARRPVQRWLWLVVIAAFVVAMGRHTPVHRWVAALPILSSSRYAVKFMVIVAAGLAVLAALSIEGLLERPRRLLAATGVHLALLVAGWSIVGSPEYVEALSWLVRPLDNGIVLAEMDLANEMHQRQSARLAWILVTAAGMVGAALAVTLRGRVAAPAVVAALVLDLALAASFGVRGADLSAHRLPETARDALRDDHQRYFIEERGPLPPIAHRADATRFDDMMRSLGQRGHHAHRVARLARGLDLDGLGNPVHGAVMTWALTAPRPEAFRMMARLGVARILSSQPDLPLPQVISWPIPGEPDEHLYRLDGVQPYVSAFTQWTIVPRAQLRPDAHRRHLLAPPGRAIVTGDAPPPGATGCGAPALEWAAPSPERIHGTITSTCSALIVAQEARVPGWTVTVDGAPAALTEAEAGYIAVVVPPGMHRYEFRFAHRSRPWALLAGAALLAAVGWAVAGPVVGWAVAGQVRLRRRRR